MGYESKLFIVRKTSLYDRKSDKVWAEVIASFDMCKYPPLADLMRRKPVTDCYIYADDGDTRIDEDRYGDELRESSITDVIKVLEEDIKCGNEYRRIFPLLEALKVFNAENEQWGDLAVLHYGY